MVDFALESDLLALEMQSVHCYDFLNHLTSKEVAFAPLSF